MNIRRGEALVLFVTNRSLLLQYLTDLLLAFVWNIIQFLKVMYLFLTLQVHPTLPSVFYETDSVFLRAET